MNTLDRINKIIAESGPLVRAEDIELNGKTETFHFRSLGFLEADTIRTLAIGPDGKFSSAQFAGNNGRIVAATLCDEVTGDLAASYEEICVWPPALVDKLAEAASKVNKFGPAQKEATVKNSEATANGASS